MDSPCIEWWGATSDSTGGYGYLYIHGKRVVASRFVWEECFGPIPDGLWVLHHCDNPPCVNPEHLFLGTNRDNMIDMRDKGRGKLGWTHCGNGHEWTEVTTYWFTHRDGHRQRMCRQCNRDRQRERTARRLAGTK